MKKTGEFLKNAREEKGLSLHEIGLALKINTKILKAIEEADTTQLPAKTFLRGFVKSYAQYLKVDTQEVLNLFSEEMGSTQPRPMVSEEPAVTTTANESVFTGAPERSKNEIKPLGSTHNSTKTIILVSLGIALVSMILFTKKIVDRYSREAQVEAVAEIQPIDDTEPSKKDDLITVEGSQSSDLLSAPLAPIVSTNDTTLTPGTIAPATTPIATNAPTLASDESEPKSKSSTEVPPSPQQQKVPTTTSSTGVTASTETIASGTTSSGSPLSNVTPVKSAMTATAAATTAPVAQKKEEVTSANQRPEGTMTLVPQKGKSVELIVEAMNAVEIEYSSASGKPTKIKLSPEQVHTFKSRDGLSLKISNGGAVNLIHNGKDLGVPGDLGKPLQLNY